jgi:hypothetical protein
VSAPSDPDEPDREALTPKVSGSLQRGPVFAGHSANIAQALEDAAVKARTAAAHCRQIWTGQLDIALSKRWDAHALALWALVRKLRDLEAEFLTWDENHDPGNDARLEAVMRMRNLESEAKELIGRAPA